MNHHCVLYHLEAKKRVKYEIQNTDVQLPEKKKKKKIVIAVYLKPELNFTL